MAAIISEADSSGDSMLPSVKNQNTISMNGGKPLQVVYIDEDTRQFELDVNLLSQVLLSDACRDRPIAVISIAGDFRKGKSFLLNILLRYLKCKGSDDWLDDYEQPLKGFSWRGGSKRDTLGILMWSEPFVVKLDDGREVAILLMDTQGTFDTKSVIKDSATVFALSTMVSSIQVYNLMHNLQGDNFQSLEIFTEYGRLALEATDVTPFQKLLFLIRDWSYPYERPYGLKGGCDLLEQELEINDKQPPQLKRVRKHIRSCFSEIDCFLMPHPGSKVATNPDFDGRLADIDSDFITQLRILVPLLLDPSHLVVKNFSGNDVTGRQLLEYFKVYINIFKGEKMPEPKSMLEATAEANNLSAVAGSKDLYMTKMESICGGTKPYINPKTLESKHLEVYDEALSTFHKSLKFGGKALSEQYVAKLKEEMALAYEHFVAQNKSKNILGTLGSTVILIFICFFCSVLTSVFSLVGLNSLSNLFFFIGTTIICGTIAYIGFRLSGTFVEFIEIIDAHVSHLYSMVIDYAFTIIAERAQSARMIRQ